MRTAIAIIFVLIASLFFTGCQNAPQANRANTQPTNSAVSSPTLKAELKTDPIFVEAGKDVEVILTIKNEQEQIVRDLPNAIDNLLHITLVTQDLSDLSDLALKLESDGTFRVHHTFADDGRYTFFVDLMTPDGRVSTQTIGFGVAGKESPKQELKADQHLSKTVAGLRVELKPDGELTAGKVVQLTITATDTTNQPDIKNENLIVISEDGKECVHAQPVSDNENALTITFPKAGLYKIWLMIDRGGKVTDVPFVVKVKPAEGEVDYSKIEIPKGAIRVTVGKEGFTPKAIEAKAGKPLTLAFIRIDQENCGTEVQFPALNIKKDLPLGKVVTVDIPAEHAGEFNFSCGMEMLKGVVMVE
jgi:Cupredoxin-like domain